MDAQIIVNWLLGVFGALIGILVRSLWQAVRDLQEADKEITEKVNSVEVLVAGQYVKQDDFNRLSEAIFKKLDRIEDKLDGKEDKQ